MKNLLLQKKALVFALTEDFLFLIFLLSILTSSLEVLLPGSISTKIPLALVFSLLAITLLFYISLLKSGPFSISNASLPRSLVFLVFVILCLVSLVMNSAFGIVGALIQIFLIALLVSFLFRK